MDEWKREVCSNSSFYEVMKIPLITSLDLENNSSVGLFSKADTKVAFCEPYNDSSLGDFKV